MSARDDLVRRKGSYHLFGLDFMIDDELGVHFIEANGYPGFTWSADFPTRTLVTQMFDMLIELHESPTAFERMTQGDMYGGFELIYNELEDDCSEKLYDPCVEFANFNRVPMKKMAQDISIIHDTGRRTRYQANIKVKADAQRAQQICISQSLPLKSAECSKAMKQDRKAKFQKIFKEIQEWNLINGTFFLLVRLLVDERKERGGREGKKKKEKKGTNKRSLCVVLFTTNSVRVWHVSGKRQPPSRNKQPTTNQLVGSAFRACST
jgi:hypothetical protein